MDLTHYFMFISAAGLVAIIFLSIAYHRRKEAAK